MAEELQALYVGAGFHTRLSIKNCDEEWITPSDVTRISYTVFKKENSRIVVSGHENVTVPTMAILTVPGIDAHSGESYNFNHTISQSTSNPFPEYNKIYVIQYRFVDTEGTAHIHEIIGRTSE